MEVTINPIERRIDYTIDDYTKTMYFKDLDEWIGDGDYFFHFEYESRSNFNTQKEWLSYMIGCYVFDKEIDGYDYSNNLIEKINLEL